MTPGRIPYAGQLALLGATYVLVGRVGLQMDAVSGFATLVWPPTGVALAALMLGGLRLWPGVFVGAFVVNAWTGAPFLVALGIAGGNTLEAVIGVWALGRVVGPSPSFERVHDVVAFVGLAALLATLVSATVGVLSLCLGGVVRWAEWPETWRAWWVGDVLGALVVAPLLTTWARGSSLPRSGRLLESCALGAALGLGTFFVFAHPVEWGAVLAQPYLLFPLLLWAALRFGPRGASAATFLVSGVAIALTTWDLGPFAHGRLSESLLHLQVFMAFDAVTFLVVAALGAESARSRRDIEIALDETHVAREQAERASELKSTFLSVVSHELRTPLASLSLQIERLRRSDATLPPDLRALVPRMSGQARRLRDLIEALLEHTRIASGRLAMSVEKFAPAALAERCAEDLRPQAVGKALDLRVETADAPPELSSDPRLVGLVVANLLSNAIKFTEKGSVVLTVARATEGARFTVEDTGPGISPDDQVRIFEPFEQLESDERGRVAGVGLGLALVRELTSSLGGSIAVRSDVGAGATFTVVLPELPAEPNDPPEVGSPS